MKKTVLTFGLISGLMISLLMGGSLLLTDKIGSGHSMALGYTIMVASFLLIYFGIRSYRDNTLAGQISFRRAFACSPDHHPLNLQPTAIFPHRAKKKREGGDPLGVMLRDWLLYQTGSLV